MAVLSRHPQRRWRRVVAIVLAVALGLQVPPRALALDQSGPDRGPTSEVDLEAACARPDQPRPTAWRLEGNDQVNAMRTGVERTLKATEARALGLTGVVTGFRAGEDYGLIYARDSATIAPTAQYFYDTPFLTRPVEEFLQLQFDGLSGDAEDGYWSHRPAPGAVSGVIGGADLTAVKTLVTSDEEPSLVHMAYVAYRAGAGKAWLLEPQAGKPRIQRLNEAMGWLFSERFEPELGLIKRGHTTDWGDVEVGAGSDASPPAAEPKEWTASIYDQAWTYRALIELAEMNTASGRQHLAEDQLRRARVLRQASAERLWQPSRGYYRTHIHIPATRHAFDEDRIVSIANAVAVYTGLADASESDPIFAALENARIQAGAAKPGLSLHPAYPLGFFDYPQMVPGRYQNGAVWDWWGGMQISGEFWSGRSALARGHLDQVASDWARAPGQVFEWQEPASRRNGGSPSYAGAAATMTQAIVAGLFGAEVGPRTFTASPRLGAQSGGIHVDHPPSGCWLDYWQTYAGERMVLEWDTNHSSDGQVRVLLPRGATLAGGQLDQQPVALALEQLGEDTYAVLSVPAPPGNHRLELRLSAVSGGERTFRR